MPIVAPHPMFRVDASVPDSVKVLLTVRVLLVVPPATVKPIDAAVSDSALYVLLDNASLPASVASVPVAGRKTDDVVAKGFNVSVASADNALESKLKIVE